MPGYGVVDPLTIYKFIANPQGPVNKIIRIIALDVQRTAAILAERNLGKTQGDAPRTGYLRKAFRVQKGSALSSWRVRNLASYFEPIELGARPHVIRATGLSGRSAQRQRASLASRSGPKVSSGIKNPSPVKRRTSSGSNAYLQFQARDGRWVKKKQVSHPGNRPYRILSRALFLAAQRNLINVRRVGTRQLP